MDVGGFFQQHGYLALVAGSVIEGETVVVLAGFAARRGYLSLPLIVAIAAVMNFGWDQFYFWLGRRHGHRVLRRFPSLRAKTERMRVLLDRHDAPLIVAVRFLYGLRIAGPIAIGIAGVPWPRFLALNLLGATLWATGFAMLGYLFGRTAELLLDDLRHHELWVVAAIAAAGLVVWLVSVRPGLAKGGGAAIPSTGERN